KNSRFSDLGEFGGGRLDRLLRFIFQIGKVQVFENEFGDLVDFNFGFVVVLARTIPGAGSDAGIVAGLALTGDYIANLGASISGAHLLLLAIVEAQLVFIERADRDFHYALAVGKNDRFIGNNGTEILFYRIADSLFVTFLIYLTLARKRPVVPLYGHSSYLKLKPARPNGTVRAFSRNNARPRFSETTESRHS